MCYADEYLYSLTKSSKCHCALSTVIISLQLRKLSGRWRDFAQGYKLTCSRAGIPTDQSTVQMLQFSSVQLLNHVRLFATPWTAARQASRPITNSWSFLKLMSIESVMPSNHRPRPCAKSGYMDTFIILLVPPPTSRGRSHHPYFTDEKTNCTREMLWLSKCHARARQSQHLNECLLVSRTLTVLYSDSLLSCEWRRQPGESQSRGK